MIQSANVLEKSALYSLSSVRPDSETAEKVPDNEAAETVRAKAPLAEGQGMKVDVEA